MSNPRRPDREAIYQKVRVFGYKDGVLRLLVHNKERGSSRDLLPENVAKVWTRTLAYLEGEPFKGALRSFLRSSPNVRRLSQQFDRFVRELRTERPDFVVDELGPDVKDISRWAIQPGTQRATVVLHARFANQWRSTLDRPRFESAKRGQELALFMSLVQQFCHIWHWRLQIDELGSDYDENVLSPRESSHTAVAPLRHKIVLVFGSRFSLLPPFSNTLSFFDHVRRPDAVRIFPLEGQTKRLHSSARLREDEWRAETAQTLDQPTWSSA